MRPRRGAILLDVTLALALGATLAGGLLQTMSTTRRLGRTEARTLARQQLVSETLAALAAGAARELALLDPDPTGLRRHELPPELWQTDLPEPLRQELTASRVRMIAELAPADALHAYEFGQRFVVTCILEWDGPSSGARRLQARAVVPPLE